MLPRRARHAARTLEESLMLGWMTLLHAPLMCTRSTGGRYSAALNTVALTERSMSSQCLSACVQETRADTQQAPSSPAAVAPRSVGKRISQALSFSAGCFLCSVAARYE